VTLRIGSGDKGKRPLSRQILYAALPTILVLLSVEGLVRLYFHVFPDIPPAVLHNPAYTSKPWFTPEFLASPGINGFYSPSGTRLVIPIDYKDRHFTVQDGIRATVGFDPAGLPPGRRPRKLYVFGGSTTYCKEVPDEYTYASQLQQRLAAIPETRDIQVFNYGVSCYVVLQDLERLEYEIAHNRIPDWCIFFDGINDVMQGIVNGDPNGTTIEAGDKKGLLYTLRRLARLSVAAKKLYRYTVSSQQRIDPEHTRSEAKVRELAQATADHYERTLLRAKELCDRHGIGMIAFLQPHLYSISGRPLTEHEQIWARGLRKSEVEAFAVGYPLLQEKLRLLRQRDIHAYDITDAFNDNLEPIFIDAFHVESTGNRLIAEAILKHALPLLKDSSSEGGAPPVERDRQAGR
jgi:lysophospholipase L1-like esterase